MNGYQRIGRRRGEDSLPSFLPEMDPEILYLEARLEALRYAFLCFRKIPESNFPFPILSLSVFLSLSLLFAREISTHRKRSKILKGLIKEERNMCKCRIYKSGAQLSALVRSLWSSCCTRGLKLYTRPSRSLGQTHTSVIPDPDLNSAVSIRPRPPSEKTFSDLLRLSIPSPSPILPDPFSFV